MAEKEYMNVEDNFSIIYEDLKKKYKDNDQILNIIDNLKYNVIGQIEFLKGTEILYNRDNTYNIDSSFVFEYGFMTENDIIDNDIIVISFHLYADDVRTGYSDFFIFKNTNIEDVIVYEDED